MIILGGIYSGHFTATESAAVAVVYALAIEIFLYRELDFAGVFAVVASTTALLGSLFPVLMFALSLNILLTYEQVPDTVVTWLSQQVTSPIAFLVGVNVLLLADAFPLSGTIVFISWGGRRAAEVIIRGCPLPAPPG